MVIYYNNREDTLRVPAKYHGMTDRFESAKLRLEIKIDLRGGAA